MDAFREMINNPFKKKVFIRKEKKKKYFDIFFRFL